MIVYLIQHEFHSIYQYFFSRRTLYLVCWKMNEYDMNEQIFDTIHNILINIQVSFIHNPEKINK